MFVRTERAAGDTALLPARLFRVRAFSIGSAQSLIIGIGMFGGLTLLPLYLQLVKGNSPTRAGLLTLPLMLGLMSGSITSGQVTSRTGHYKIFPVVGSAALVAGMLMLWRLSADSSLVYAGLSMAVVGLGIGMNMQTVVLAMQNAVPPRDIGVSTSSATFFRQMGGTIGVAVYLSIVYSIVQDHIRTAYLKAAQSPSFLAVAQAHPDQIAKLRSGGTSTSTLNDTSFLNHFNPTLTHPFKEGFTSALTIAFLIGAFVLVLAFVLAVLQREVPLRTVGAQQAAAEEEARLAARRLSRPVGRASGLKTWGCDRRWPLTEARSRRQYRDQGWWRDETLADDIARHAAARPDAPAFITETDRVGWREYAEASDQLAGVLVAAGFQPRGAGRRPAARHRSRAHRVRRAGKGRPGRGRHRRARRRSRGALPARRVPQASGPHHPRRAPGTRGRRRVQPRCRPTPRSCVTTSYSRTSRATARSPSTARCSRLRRRRSGRTASSARTSSGW